jgi:hypothetical protein
MIRASSDRHPTSLREQSLHCVRSQFGGVGRRGVGRSVLFASALLALSAVFGCGSVRGTGKPLIQQDLIQRVPVAKDAPQPAPAKP